MPREELNEELFRSLEQRLHRSEIRSMREAVNELLADGFLEFGSSGRVYNKLTTMEALAAETVTSPPPEVFDFSVISISPDAVLVTYRSFRHPTEKSAGRQTLRSSIWKSIDGRWQMLFHQGTVIPDEATPASLQD